MESIVMAGSIAPESRAERLQLATVSTAHDCAYCGSPIVPGERWVREKIYEPFTGSGPRYQRYHADLFGDQELSCWEKHELEHENTRIAGRAA